MPPSIIRNFGLFWEREHILWGQTGNRLDGSGENENKGHLYGFKSDPDHKVDFREQRGIYVLYEGSSIPSQRVVYIGQAGSGKNDLFHRLRHHRKEELWNRWQRFSWFGFLNVGNNNKLVHKKKNAIGNIEFATALDQLEAVLIGLFEPLKNKQGPRWRGAVEYYQCTTTKSSSGD